MPLPPQLSPEQRQAALDKAAAARRQRAELKEKLKMGSLTLKELLDQSERDEVVGKMKVLAVLESLPGLGKVKEDGLRCRQGEGAAQRDVGCRFVQVGPTTFGIRLMGKIDPSLAVVIDPKSSH